MATEKPEGDGFLAVIEAKIAALKALADSYRTAVSLGAIGQAGEIDLSVVGSPQGARNDSPIELPQGALLGKSLPAAVELYLASVRKKQTIREIANALKAGGVESTSDNFENVVTGAVNRLKMLGKVLRFKDGWALAEFYPANIRASLAKDAKPTRKTANAARGKKSVARKGTPKAKTSTGRRARRPAGAKTHKAREPLRPGLEQRISAYLQTRVNEFTTVQELVNQLNVPAQVLNLTLGKMRKAERIEKNQNGLIRLTKKAAA